MKTGDALCKENVYILNETQGLDVEEVVCERGKKYYYEDYGDCYYIGTNSPSIEVKMDSFEFMDHFQKI